MRLLVVALFVLLTCAACGDVSQAAGEAKTVVSGPLQLHYQPERLVTETPLALTVDAPAGWLLQSAKLTGISMEMSFIPLFFTREGDRWHSQFLLGACADAQMTWRLELIFSDQKGAEQRLTDEFIVYRR